MRSTDVQLSPVLKTRMWLETEKGMLLGMGRAKLLLAIERNGSLNKAAKEMGMSYRAAWGRLKATEETLGHPLAIADGEGRRMRLTPEGKALAKAFLDWYANLERVALETAREAFPWDVRGFEETDRSADEEWTIPKDEA